MADTELGGLLKDVLNMRREDAIYKKVYVFPPFAEDLTEVLPRLVDDGFEVTSVSAVDEEGEVISAKVTSPSGNIFNLGSVLLTGDTVKVQSDLALVKDLIRFVDSEVEKSK